MLDGKRRVAIAYLGGVALAIFIVVAAGSVDRDSTFGLVVGAALSGYGVRAVRRTHATSVAALSLVSLLVGAYLLSERTGAFNRLFAH